MGETIQDHFVVLQAGKKGYISCPLLLGGAMQLVLDNRTWHRVPWPQTPHTKYQVTTVVVAVITLREVGPSLVLKSDLVLG